MFLGLFLLGCGALAAAPACVIEESDSDTTKCKTGKCTVNLGGRLYCSQCAKADEYLIDGKCLAQNNVDSDNDICTAQTSANGTCASCKKGYFLHEGGCYKIAAEPGSLVCADEASATGGIDGVCTACVAGYFKNPAATVAAKQSCIPCGQDTAIDHNKGVEGCAECAAPDAAGTADNEKQATCRKCSSDRYLKKEGKSPATCVAADACKNTHFPKTDTSSGNTCAECNSTDDGGIEDCTACAPITPAARMGNILVTCSACGKSKKVRPDKKGCIDTCPDNSEEKDGKAGICECVDNYRPTADGTACEPGKPEPPAGTCTIPLCKKCSEDKKTCAECEDGKYLTPAKLCVSDCAELPSYYGATEDNKNVCKQCTVKNCRTCKSTGKCETCEDGFYGEECLPCDSSCKTCSDAGAEGCTSCPTKKVLVYGSDNAKGTCGPECTTGTGKGGCETCGLTVGDSAYCSKCATTGEYPKNGVCGDDTMRTAMCESGQIANGACTKCAAGYFLMDGGCYETTRLPGKIVCKKDGAGQCTEPAEGYTLDSNSLVTCSAGCSVCTDANTCTTCMGGYYLDNKACTACPTGCSTCSGATTCTACKVGYYLNGSACTACPGGCLACTTSGGEVMCLLTDGSVNQSGLSTGAIAGIAVAAIIVVGGLAGFLAWWFACRGKA